MLFTKHPDLKAHIGKAKTYKVLDSQGNITEIWHKQEDGRWTDDTKLYFAQLEVEKLQAELAKIDVKPSN